MKKEIQKIIQNSLKDFFEYKIDIELIEVEGSKKDEYGDYTTNIALKCAKTFHKTPMDLSCELAEKIKNKYDLFEKIEWVHPGFINFFVKPNVLLENLESAVHEINLNKILLKNLLQKCSLKQILEVYDLEKIESVQYIHSRIHSIIKIFKEEGITIQSLQEENFHIEVNDVEKNLMKKITNYPNVVQRFIDLEKAEELIKYMFELSELFYKFHEKILFRKLDKPKLYVTLKIVDPIRIIIKDILDIFSIDAPEKM